MKVLIAALFVLLSMIPLASYGDHNSNRPDHNPNRGYTEENCKLKYSPVTKTNGQWLGHKIGCMVNEGTHYSLITEYQILFFMEDDAKGIIKHAKENPDAELFIEIEPEPKGIAM